MGAICWGRGHVMGAGGREPVGAACHLAAACNVPDPPRLPRPGAQILDSLQMARIVVQSWPFFPNVASIALVLCHKRGMRPPGPPPGIGGGAGSLPDAAARSVQLSAATAAAQRWHRHAQLAA